MPGGQSGRAGDSACFIDSVATDSFGDYVLRRHPMLPPAARPRHSAWAPSFLEGRLTAHTRQGAIMEANAGRVPRSVLQRRRRLITELLTELRAGRST